MRRMLRLFVVACVAVGLGSASDGAAQGLGQRSLVFQLSDGWFDRAAQEALMSAVPWKDLAYQFFPRQNAPVVVEFQDAKGVVTLDKDARNRVFDVERARLLFARTRFGGERRVEVSCTSPDACQIRDWLRPYFKNVGLDLVLDAKGDPRVARLNVNVG